MALTQVTGPYPIFTDLDGTPLDDGYLYIGAINQDPEQNPIQVFWDANLTIAATQPIRTSNGYAYRNGTPALLYTGGEFSITIRNKREEFVLYSPVGYGFDPAAVSASVVKNDFIGDGVEVDFVLSASPSTKLATNIFINGVYQEKDSYTLAGNTITFSIAPPLNSSIEVMTNETGVINTGNATAISYTASFAGATLQTVQTKLEQYVSVKDFGAVGDGVADDTAAIQAAIDNGAPFYIPAGTYRYSALTGMDVDNFTMRGDGSGSTTLKFTGTGIAFDVGTSAAFRQGMDISGFTIEGNANTTALFRASALARCQITDINVREANGTTGIGFLLRGCQLSRFTSLMCSQDRNAMTNAPTEGLNIEALAPYGNSSNNVFTHCYFEGNGITEPTIDVGVRISGGDQNTFVGGSPESCKTYGMLVGANCRYNTFMGVGFENLDATADVGDSGISSRYINCYSSESFIIQDRSCVVQGGYFERIQIDNTASRARVQDVTVNNWATGNGGFFDLGTASFYSNIYDIDAGDFIYPEQSRTSITIGASPATWVNDTGLVVNVVAQTGTLTQVRIIRGTDFWLQPIATPNNYLLNPNDEIEFSYSVAPLVSYVPFNGFQG